MSKYQFYKNNSVIDYDDVSSMFVDGASVKVVFKSGAIVNTSGYDSLATEFRKYCESKVGKQTSDEE